MLGTNQNKGLRFPVTPLFVLVAGPGFEPGTFGMVTRRSAAIQALASRKFKIWKKILSSFSNSENRPLGDNGCRGLYQETYRDPTRELAFGS